MNAHFTALGTIVSQGGAFGRGALALSLVVHGGIAAAFVGWGEPTATPADAVPVAFVTVAESGDHADAAPTIADAGAPHRPSEATAEPALPTENPRVSPATPPAIEVREAATPTAEPAPLPEPPAAAIAEEPPLPKPPAPAAHASPDFATAPDEPPAAASETFPDAAAERATVPPAPPVATGDVPAMEPVATPAAVQSASLPSETSSAAGMDDPAIQPARYDVAALGNPKPDYPWLSRQRGEEGRVVLRVEVTATGEVARIEVAESSGHRRLDEAALETVAAWRFDPARVGDQPIATTVNVPVTFQLQN